MKVNEKLAMLGINNNDIINNNNKIKSNNNKINYNHININDKKKNMKASLYT